MCDVNNTKFEYGICSECQSVHRLYYRDDHVPVMDGHHAVGVNGECCSREVIMGGRCHHYWCKGMSTEPETTKIRLSNSTHNLGNFLRIFS